MREKPAASGLGGWRRVRRFQEWQGSFPSAYFDDRGKVRASGARTRAGKAPIAPGLGLFHSAAFRNFPSAECGISPIGFPSVFRPRGPSALAGGGIGLLSVVKNNLICRLAKGRPKSQAFFRGGVLQPV